MKWDGNVHAEAEQEAKCEYVKGSCAQKLAELLSGALVEIDRLQAHVGILRCANIEATDTYQDIMREATLEIDKLRKRVSMLEDSVTIYRLQCDPSSVNHPPALEAVAV